MDILDLTIDMFKSYLLVLIRVGIVLFAFPIFGGKKVPMPIKAGIAFSMALMLVPVVHPDPILFPDNPWQVVFLVLSEIILGLALGLTVDFFFASVQLAGQMAGFQMGFAIATVMDPNSGQQSSLISQLGYWIALMTFVLMNGHHIVLFAIKESFSIIQPGALVLNEGIFRALIGLTSEMFVLAIKMGAPVIAALLFTDTAMALIAKVSPQMNILIVAMPLKIAIGLYFFGICLQIILYLTSQYLSTFLALLKNIMKLMS